MRVRTRIKFYPLTKSSEEILEYVTSLVKQYCLETEWKLLEEVFVGFYTLYQIEQKRYDIQQADGYESSLVVRLLNNIYINHLDGGNEDIARKLACNIALRCDCYNYLTF